MASGGFGEYLDRLGGAGTMRVVHVVLNIVAATLGIFFLIIGTTGAFDLYKSFGGTTVPVMSIVLGGLVTMISLVGIVGSIKRSQYMFGTYSGLLAILVIVQLIALTMIWLRPGDIEDKFGNVWEGFYENDPDTIRYIERDLKCCGFKSPVDMPVPANCSLKKHYGFTVGCLKPLAQQWRAQRRTVLWAGFGMVGAQILALVLGAELGRRYMNARHGEYQRVPGERNEASPLIRA
ncbi:hypothetical protein GGI25_002997 [Coemansia spiralis]|uniref:Tetraspanin n=2 Tax=Coemansia TaxID=4863 RepID=A0A9W8G9D6_9FUNG|nr:Tetraspanin family-domain-containing protein [Coemansia spiralis]KAJ1992176.1 hypothetical protein EDC05_003005 [Coemansia umbellata]KAJ2622003.1 hypothetical protein GGI26_003579 [Coemansia sp. RSA 1358]KAJ2677607.1 hypothetical protein GGI25_002997 [Coemansia spiralis]